MEDDIFWKLKNIYPGYTQILINCIYKNFCGDTFICKMICRHKRNLIKRMTRKGIEGKIMSGDNSV